MSAFHSDRQNGWKQFRLGGGLNVVVENPNVPAEPQWRVETGGTYSSSPSVAGDALLFANNDSHVYAIGAGTGKVRWRTLAANEVMTQPIYEGKTAFVGAGNSGSTFWGAPFYKLIGAGPSELLSLDLRDGNILWRVQLPGTGMPTPAFVGPVLIHGNGAGIVFGVNRADGSYRWEPIFILT
ncbi:MAG TPA: PQQ-binding-like beta-propeller repeat protein [Candidatus Baltobacteraceae bacterium]|nr:PQQ-binding-like beta-propeller repeat protein [Candidatus Baltobacteraceae bacterium]